MVSQRWRAAQTVLLLSALSGGCGLLIGPTPPVEDENPGAANGGESTGGSAGAMSGGEDGEQTGASGGVSTLASPNDGGSSGRSAGGTAAAGGAAATGGVATGGANVNGSGGSGGEPAGGSGGSSLGGFGGDAGPHCGTPDGVCPSQCSPYLDPDCVFPLGHACSQGMACTVACADGVCCESGCNTACHSCNNPSNVGRCTQDDLSADPLNCGTCGNTCKWDVCAAGSCQGVALGDEFPSGSTATFPGNEVRCRRITLPEPLEIRRLGVHTITAGVPVRLALYQDQGDLPGTLYNQTAALVSRLGPTVGEISPTPLLPGSYFLCLITADEISMNRNVESVQVTLATTAFGPYPESAVIMVGGASSIADMFAIGFAP